MVAALCLYVDDSGNRLPDHRGGTTPKWFGLGGILLWEKDENAAREQYAAFRSTWINYLPLDIPLHSYEIRQRKGPFSWLKTDADVASRFYSDLQGLVMAQPVLATACVIDRAGYAARYFDKYDVAKRWALCKTAFAVLLERTVKYAAPKGARLRVYVERTDQKTDRQMLEYYRELRTTGMPFDGSRMATYTPLGADVLSVTLYDFKTKDKTSPLMQLADLCLYPLCNAGYDQSGRDYRAMVEHRKLIDSVLDPSERKTLGIKYSCFDQRQEAAVQKA
jgi:Protein of unknown function (DUF3800)